MSINKFIPIEFEINLNRFNIEVSTFYQNVATDQLNVETMEASRDKMSRLFTSMKEFLNQARDNHPGRQHAQIWEKYSAIEKACSKQLSQISERILRIQLLAHMHQEEAASTRTQCQLPPSSEGVRSLTSHSSCRHQVFDNRSLMLYGVAPFLSALDLCQAARTRKLCSQMWQPRIQYLLGHFYEKINDLRQELRLPPLPMQLPPSVKMKHFETLNTQINLLYEAANEKGRLTSAMDRTIRALSRDFNRLSSWEVYEQFVESSEYLWEHAEGDRIPISLPATRAHLLLQSSQQHTLTSLFSSYLNTSDLAKSATTSKQWLVHCQTTTQAQFDFLSKHVDLFEQELQKMCPHVTLPSILDFPPHLHHRPLSPGNFLQLQRVIQAGVVKKILHLARHFGIKKGDFLALDWKAFEEASLLTPNPQLHPLLQKNIAEPFAAILKIVSNQSVDVLNNDSLFTQLMHPYPEVALDFMTLPSMLRGPSSELVHTTTTSARFRPDLCLPIFESLGRLAFGLHWRVISVYSQEAIPYLLNHSPTRASKLYKTSLKLDYINCRVLGMKSNKTHFNAHYVGQWIVALVETHDLKSAFTFLEFLRSENINLFTRKGCVSTSLRKALYQLLSSDFPRFMSFDRSSQFLQPIANEALTFYLKTHPNDPSCQMLSRIPDVMMIKEILDLADLGNMQAAHALIPTRVEKDELYARLQFVLIGLNAAGRSLEAKLITSLINKAVNLDLLRKNGMTQLELLNRVAKPEDSASEFESKDES